MAIYIVCNNDAMILAVRTEDQAQEQVDHLKAENPDPRCYFHYHELELLEEE